MGRPISPQALGYGALISATLWALIFVASGANIHVLGDRVLIGFLGALLFVSLYLLSMIIWGIFHG